MKLKKTWYYMITIAVCLIGCEQGDVGSLLELTPTLKIESTATPEPTITLEPTNTPQPTQSLSFEEVEKQRETEKQVLLVSPTPGPEPYALFDAEKAIEVGDVVMMGEYCHGKNPYSSFETKFPIKWLVLEKGNDKALLISLFNVDSFPFVDDDSYFEIVDSGKAVCWESSTIREILNEGFFHWVFTDEEKACVCRSIIHTPDNPIYGTGGGEDTMDYLFLLSIDEVQKYFLSDEERRTQIVPDVEIEQYDLMPGTHYLNTTDFYDWWLRSPGDSEDSFACVGRFGDVMEAGQWSSSEEVSVRPAMWVDLNKIKEVGLEMTEAE